MLKAPWFSREPVVIYSIIVSLFFARSLRWNEHLLEHLLHTRSGHCPALFTQRSRSFCAVLEFEVSPWRFGGFLLKLVGGLEHGSVYMTFLWKSWEWNVIIPTDFHSLHHFSEEFLSTTNQIYIYIIYISINHLWWLGLCPINHR